MADFAIGIHQDIYGQGTALPEGKYQPRKNLLTIARR